MFQANDSLRGPRRKSAQHASAVCISTAPLGTPSCLNSYAPLAGTLRSRRLFVAGPHFVSRRATFSRGNLQRFWHTPTRLSLMDCVAHQGQLAHKGRLYRGTGGRGGGVKQKRIALEDRERFRFDRTVGFSLWRFFPKPHIHHNLSYRRFLAQVAARCHVVSRQFKANRFPGKTPLAHSLGSVSLSTDSGRHFHAGDVARPL